MENKNFNHPLKKNYIKDKIVGNKNIYQVVISMIILPQELADGFGLETEKTSVIIETLYLNPNCDIYDIIEQNKDNDIYKDVIFSVIPKNYTKQLWNIRCIFGKIHKSDML